MIRNPQNLVAEISIQHRQMNKHSESIAKAIQIPYRPNKFSRGINPTTADQKGQKVISSQ